MLAVKEAQQQSAYQQEQDALAIQQAQQNLTNTYKSQQLQMAATMSTSNQAANQFVKDMSRLSAPARDLVRQLLSMHGAWRLIEKIAQGAILPGMTAFLPGSSRSCLRSTPGFVRWAARCRRRSATSAS